MNDNEDFARHRPLENLLFLTSTAHKLILNVFENKTYAADAYDFELLKKIANIGDYTRIIITYTEICLRLRAMGEAEPCLPDPPNDKI